MDEDKIERELKVANSLLSSLVAEAQITKASIQRTCSNLDLVLTSIHNYMSGYPGMQSISMIVNNLGSIAQSIEKIDATLQGVAYEAALVKMKEMMNDDG